MTREELEKVRLLRETGKSYSYIADLLRVSVNTVKSACRRNGIENFNDRQHCMNCRRRLDSVSVHRRTFCSNTCRYQWDYHHRVLTEQNAEARVCPVCGKEFFHYPSAARKYCSHGCYIAARYGRRRNDKGERIAR